MPRILPLFLITLLLAPASNAEKRLLWGDTHLHTSYSLDAYTNNNFTADPRTAYRYAMGEPVIHPYNRARVQIGTPLDFLIVSDHAEYLGAIRRIHTEGVDTSEVGLWDSITALLSTWYLNYRLDQGDAADLFVDILPPPLEVREAAADKTFNGQANRLPPMTAAQRETWHSQVELADEYYQPGEFTTFIGWEWTSIPGGANLHRVVFTDGNQEVGKQFRPYSLLDSQYPEDLWAWLDDISTRTGAGFLAIPHNPTVSKGYMFDTTRLRGGDLDSDYIAARRRWEPVTEITQIKGDSETHPELSPEDEFANFETFPFYLQVIYTPYVVAPGDYVRSALTRGLALERQYGANPYQFGLIGSTDAHTGIPSAEEDNFWGKMASDSVPEKKTQEWDEGERSPDGWAMSASGLAAVWAEDNTRESIMAAMKRREVYATSGPRIRLQFYGSPDFGDLALDSAELYSEAVGRGVAMGGELAGGASPEFLVQADRDPVGANLDRIQIVKGWLDGSGEQHEKVYNVSWSGDRELDAAGKLPPVGNTVDLRTGAMENSIGAPQLSARWRDPDYQPGQAAFYYARVIQVPTARHSLLDAIALGLVHADDHPDTIQERAYSSPIWVTAE